MLKERARSSLNGGAGEIKVRVFESESLGKYQNKARWGGGGGAVVPPQLTLDPPLLVTYH